MQETAIEIPQEPFEILYKIELSLLVIASFYPFP